MWSPTSSRTYSPMTFWFLRGLRVGGVMPCGPLRLARPPSLMSPVHPSWARADDAFVPLPAPKMEATSLRDFAVQKRVAISDAQLVKRLKIDGTTKTVATNGVASFLLKYRPFSSFAAKLAEYGEPFDASSIP